jgi:deglycase
MATVAFLVDEMFEDSEFRIPYDRLRKAGHEVVIVGQTAGKKINGKKGRVKVITDKSIDEVAPSDFAAVVIPGGYSPDHLRMNRKMVALVRDTFHGNRPLAAVCHAPWMLAEADVADGRVLTSWPSIKTDMVNAGALWIDREVVEDGNLITSRKPDDLEAFTAAILRQIAEGPAARMEPPADTSYPSHQPSGV